MEKIISACGLVCSGCEAYLATKDNDDELRKATSEKWSTMYGADINPEAINCTGCMEEGVKLGHCGECKIRVCVIAKGYQNCAPCDEFPCEIVNMIYKMAPEAKKNIEEIKEKL
ncbi:MAG: DUF3795 domain-containing protein [Candidatus Zophobacter franzmannii]|jgi:hypothetical protein|nr:DUF3795 domain-containing protein [Candidatus Zophobacter franzmannii]